MTTPETHPFQAEVSQVLELVINSLYSHREIFLRELISNASDAVDRLRYRSLTDKGLTGTEGPAAIRLLIDHEAGTLTVRDFGLGMTHDELMKNLGTVAHSGTKAFLEAIKQDSGDVSQIGQFGVGFYSAFLVADRVDVVSRAAEGEEVWCWSSDAKSSFTLEPSEREHSGTDVVLHLGDDHAEFLDEWRLRGLVKKYSDYIPHPIELQVERAQPVETTETDTESTESESAEAESAEPEGAAAEGADGESAEPATVMVASWEQINSGSALWQRSKSDISDDDYEAFYKHLTHDWEGPLTRSHFKVEGTKLFTGLLFVPTRPPFDLFSPDTRHGVRLYVRRVFIMDDCDELLPRWLRFVRGVVDSDDLPLNVSREMLQDSTVVQFIRKAVTKKALDMIAGLSKDEDQTAYETLWDSYGVVLKEGLHLSPEHKGKLGGLLRFKSSHGDGWTSLDAYLERMPEGQDAIYVVMAHSLTAAKSSPHAEALEARGYEVLYLTDPIDEWVVNALEGWDDADGNSRPLVSAMRADLKLDEPEESGEDKEQREEAAGALKELLARFSSVLGERVSEVRISRRLTSSPACLVVPDGAMHAHVERLLRAQERGQGFPSARRILELNGDHRVIGRLRELHTADAESTEVAEWIELIHDQALLAEGSPIEEPAATATRMTRLMEAALGVTITA